MKYRSTLHSIQLALLCNTSTVKEYGYKNIMHPLLQDLIHLEQTGLFIDQLGATVKGTVFLYVFFFESFTVGKFCRFCMATRNETWHTEIGTENFEPRTEDMHNRHIEEVKQDPSLSKLYGLKRSCPLTFSCSNWLPT